MKTELSKTGGFSHIERVKSSADIQELFKKGKRVSTEGAKLFVLANTLSINRIAFTLPRGYGTAVQRNYSKRLSRESYRGIKASLKTGYDMILLVYKGNDAYAMRCAQIRFLCKKADLYL